MPFRSLYKLKLLSLLLLLLINKFISAQTSPDTIPLYGETNIKHYTIYGDGILLNTRNFDSTRFGVNVHDSAIINGGAVGSNFFISLYRTITVNGQVYTGNRMSIGAGNKINGNLVARNDEGISWNSISAAGSNQIGGDNNGGLIHARGNIEIDNTGTVLGPVRIQNPFLYTGPTPTNGVFYQEAVDMPIMPVMPTPLTFPEAGRIDLTNTTTLKPGSYGNIILNGGDTITFSTPGTYVFQSISAGEFNAFNFVIPTTSTDGFRIYVHGDVDLGPMQVMINGEAPTTSNNFPLASRIYLETHGNGSSNQTGTAFRINDATNRLNNWAGTVYAPYGRIAISSVGAANVVRVNGALWSAMQVVIGARAEINYEPLNIQTTESIIDPYYDPPPGGKVDEDNNKIGAELNAIKSTSVVVSPDDHIFQVEGDKVWIEIIAIKGNVESLRSTLESMGMTNFVSNEPGSLTITGLFPRNKLNDINALDQVDYARPLFEPITKAGAVITEGAKTMKADLVAAGFPSIKGADIKIGVLSDSYDKSSATIEYAPQDQAAGEVPADLQIVLENFIGLKSDEGRAMIQIIHDIAPDAKLAFRTGFISAGDFSNGIRQLASSSLPGGKCNVIVDDISYITEPFFKDGVISKAVDEVVANGTTYVTSAGNFGSRSFEDDFTPVTTHVLGADRVVHNFGSSGAYQKLNLKPGTYTILLQWEDNFYSLGGPGNTGAIHDLDFYLVDMSGNLLFGFNRNNIGADPFEVLPFIVNADTEAQLVIAKANDAPASSLRFKYIMFRGAGEIVAHSGSSTIVGQANARGAITVGAILYDDPNHITGYPVGNLPAGYSHPSVSSFSSRGGLRITGESDHRVKPDIIGPNGVETTVPLGIYDFDGDGRFNFFGTSAAAPHIAAIAGLIIEAKKKLSNIDITPGELRNLLNSTTAPLSSSTTHSTTSGYGLANADAAMKTFANPTPTLVSLHTIDAGSNLLPVPSNTTIPFTLVAKGFNISDNTVIYVDGIPITTTKIGENLHSLDFTTANPNTVRVRLFTPAVSASELDGGFSNELIGLYIKPLVEVRVNNSSRKYAENNPAFSATVTLDGTPVTDATQLFTLNVNLTQGQFSTTATPTSPVYVYPITVSIIPNSDYQYNIIPGSLKVERLPVTITPQNQTITYGEYINEVMYNYVFSSSNINPLANVLSSVRTEHRRYVASKALAILHNYSTASPALTDNDLLNKSAVASFQSFKHSRKMLLNSTNELVPLPAMPDPNKIRYLIDVSAQSLNDFKTNPNELNLINTTASEHQRGLVSIRAINEGQALTRLSNGQLMTISNGQLLTISNGEIITNSNNQVFIIENNEVKLVASVQISTDGTVTYNLEAGGSTTLSNGQLMTISNGQLMTISNGQLMTISNGQLMTISNGQLMTISNGNMFIVVNGEIQFINSVTIAADGEVTYNMSNGQLMTISNGQLMTISNGQLMTISNGQLMTISNGQLMTISNGQLMTISNGEMFIVVNGEIQFVSSVEVAANGVVTYTMSNGQLMTISNGQLMTISNGQLMTISNGQLMTISNGEELIINNSQELVILINGQLMTISNTSGSSGANNSNTGVMVILEDHDIEEQGGAISGFIPVNMISGLDVGNQKLIPASFINDNFDISYGYGTVTVEPILVELSSPNPVPVNQTLTITATFYGAVLEPEWIYTLPSTEVEIVTPTTTTELSFKGNTPAVYGVYLKYKNTAGREFNTPTVYAVFYDPTAGFVTGGGWIQSPIVTYVQYMSASGKAHFGFESKYKKGQTIPTGETEFKFQAGGMSFISSSYEWLVVSGSRAQYKGKGTINDEGDYGFILTAVDGNLSSTTSPDQFRIKIWDTANDVVVYDNQYGKSDDASSSEATKIGGGSIVIHTGKTTKSEAVTMEVSDEQAPLQKLTVTSVPNPSSSYFTLIIKSGSDAPVDITIYDLLGRIVERKNGLNSNCLLRVGNNYKAGVYIVELQQGFNRQMMRIVKTAR